MNGIRELMAEVAATQRTELHRRHLQVELERRLATAAAPARASRPPLWRVVGLGTAVVAAAVVVFAVGARRERSASLSFDIGGPDHPGRVGDTIAPSADGTSLVFSDGSRVTVAANASARVDALGEDGATVTVVDGTLDVSVVHRAQTRWQVRAGDYRVQVTGTRFAVNWRAGAAALEVRMFEGAVAVTGPGVAPGSSRVVAGQSLHVTAGAASEVREDPVVEVVGGLAPPAPAPPVRDVARGPHVKRPIPARETIALNAPARSGGELGGPPRARPTNRAPDPAGSVRLAPASGPTLTPTPIPPSGSALAPAVASSSVVGTPSDWRTLAARGRYHEALQAAIASNFDSQCQRLAADDLLLLGDVARLDGDATRANHAYGVALTRFPNTDRTTFALGVIAFESRHDYADAARWFDRYLHDHPRGPLATAAAGRLMESFSRGGDATRARAAARAYLHEHPQGPHAALARRIASGS